MRKAASTAAERAAGAVREGLRRGKKLLFLVGNGASLMEFYSPESAVDALRKAGKKAGGLSSDEWAWHMHERARLLSSNWRPSPVHSYIVSAIKADKTEAVITANFDCFFENAFEKSGLSGMWRQNPVLDAKQWDMEGYRSRRQGAQRDIRLWKVHGDVQYGVFTPCNHVFRLPSFLLPYFSIEKMRRYLSRHCTRGSEAWLCLHFHRGYGVDPKSDVLLMQAHSTLSLLHFIDFEFTDRRIFEPDMAGASGEIHSPRVGAIIVVGFRGEQSAPKRTWEELTTPLISRCRSGTPVIMLTLSRKARGTSSSALHDEILKVNPDYVVYDDCAKSLKELLNWLSVDTDRVFANWTAHSGCFAEKDS
jgi:hypothetical protein